MNHRQWVVILRAYITLIPSTILVTNRIGRRIVIHRIQNRRTVITCWYAMELTLHSIDACRKAQAVFQNLGRNQRTTIKAIHTSTTNDTLMVHVAQTCHIFSLLIAACYRQIMIVTETRTKHFILPISISPSILNDFTSRTKLGSGSHIEFL